MDKVFTEPCEVLAVHRVPLYGGAPPTRPRDFSGQIRHIVLRYRPADRREIPGMPGDPFFNWKERLLRGRLQRLALLACKKKERDKKRHADANKDNHRSEEHTSELQSRLHLVCRLLLEKKKNKSKHVI